jgi:hypothetical protein
MRSAAMGALVVSVASLLFALAACGGESAAEREQARRADGELLLREVRSRAQAEAATEAQALKEECQQQIGEFIDALSELDARVSVAITLEAYSEKGRAVSAAPHHEQSQRTLSERCRSRRIGDEQVHRGA